jgi:hypothetical protein
MLQAQTINSTAGTVEFRAQNYTGAAASLRVQVHPLDYERLFASPRRLKASNSQTTYIIYFFFIVLFGLAATLTICGVANYEYPRDSLLYAKFIAEVGR